MDIEYPRARLVFTDAEGGLMPLDEVETLIGQTGRLECPWRVPMAVVRRFLTFIWMGWFAENEEKNVS